MHKLEVSREVKEALDVIRETPYPLYSLLNWANPDNKNDVKKAFRVLNEWTIEPCTAQREEEQALRYILGEDTVKVKPVEFKLLKGATITLGTGDVVTLSKELTVQGNIRG